ncbi:hypothetical protein DRN98_08285 [Methanosarcinales archaeon]|nr:MAG: hypothetical protein DRN98_08285 [Methanosarcinales archaeon]
MFSIIIPAHQEEKYIGETLGALSKVVEGECKNNCEVIVVCNACTDRTADISRTFRDKLNIRVIETGKRGVSFARNLGAKYAKGNILVFLDADIVISKGFLTAISRAVKDGAEIGTCKARASSNRLFDNILMMLKSLTHYFGVSTGVIFVTRRLFERIGGFNEDLSVGEDGDFIRRAMKQGKYKVADAYIFNNMRRFEKKGYINIFLFWIKHAFSGKNTKKYEVVR